MTIEKAVLARHFLCQYKEAPLSEEQVATLTEAMDKNTPDLYKKEKGI